MKKFTMFATLAMVMVFALSSFASDELPKFTKGNSMIYGGSANFTKAAGDTIDLMGPTGTFSGNFTAGWSGWSSHDYTAKTVSHWNISNYNQLDPLDLALWCGDLGVLSCTAADTIGGYAANWNDIVAYRVAVANPLIGASVAVTAQLQHDSEPAYDYTYLGQKIQGNFGFTNIGTWDDLGWVDVSLSMDYLPIEYIDGTDIYVVWQFIADGGADGGDCGYQGAGAAQVDDVTVTVTQVNETDIAYFEDFQLGFGSWFTVLPVAVGDFAGMWTGLEDADACLTNYSQQAAFIDDGIVVPGTGGSVCLDWCYGPSGYIVNPSGGLAGPDEGLNNAVYSPVMPWPNASYDGIRLAFDVYVHEDLAADSPAVVYYWGIRSADTDDSAGNGVQVLDEQFFQNRNFITYGSASYGRSLQIVTDLMNPGRDEIQVELAAFDHPAFPGQNGTPAPYFDNVSVKVYPFVGPGLATRELDIANDNFPEIGTINLNPLQLIDNSVRFDMANNSSYITEDYNGVGDSIVIDIVPVRTGAVLSGVPSLIWTMQQNSMFGAGERTSVYGMATSGVAFGDTAVGRTGNPDPDAWAFDLPDTGFLFPGDIIHYYISADDDAGGIIQNSTMPGDITGYGDFSHPLAYSTDFTVRALPSPNPDGSHPGILFWNDNGDRGGENEWYGAMDNLAMVAGEDYDIYHVNAPSSGVGNGLGGRASALVLDGYDDMLYTSGALSKFTISNGDFGSASDPSNDIQVLLAWLAAGNRDMFLTGDGFISDLGINAGGDGVSFMETVLGLNITSPDVRPLIGNQATPLILDETGMAPADDVFQTINTWIAYGGCFGINAFDAVTPRVGAVRQAEFADASGASAYPYAAANLNYHNTTNRIVTMPYDFMFVYTDPSAAKAPAPMSARTNVLSDVLAFFGVSAGSGIVSDVPGAGAKFAVSNFPNPFNPSTKISYTIKSKGHLTMKIFNVRGELVKTLIDGHVEASDSIVWNGTNNQGSSVSSGVYFYEARMGNDVQVSKMALVK